MVVSFVLSLPARGGDAQSQKLEGGAVESEPATNDCGSVLKQYVNDQGMVNYKALKAN